MSSLISILVENTLVTPTLLVLLNSPSSIGEVDSVSLNNELISSLTFLSWSSSNEPVFSLLKKLKFERSKKAAVQFQD